MEQLVNSERYAQLKETLHRTVTVATGKLALPYLYRCVERIRQIYPNVHVDVYGIENQFFGEMITVSGLVTGSDSLAQLSDVELGTELLLPCNMLRSGENVFLDDVTVIDLEEKLKVNIRVVDQPGKELVEAVLGENPGKRAYRRQIYEQTDCSYCGQTECGEIDPV